MACRSPARRADSAASGRPDRRRRCRPFHVSFDGGSVRSHGAPGNVQSGDRRLPAIPPRRFDHLPRGARPGDLDQLEGLVQELVVGHEEAFDLVERLDGHALHRLELERPARFRGGGDEAVVALLLLATASLLRLHDAEQEDVHETARDDGVFHQDDDVERVAVLGASAGHAAEVEGEAHPDGQDLPELEQSAPRVERVLVAAPARRLDQDLEQVGDGVGDLQCVTHRGGTSFFRMTVTLPFLSRYPRLTPSRSSTPSDRRSSSRSRFETRWRRNTSSFTTPSRMTTSGSPFTHLPIACQRNAAHARSRWRRTRIRPATRVLAIGSLSVTIPASSEPSSSPSITSSALRRARKRLSANLTSTSNAKKTITVLAATSPMAREMAQSRGRERRRSPDERTRRRLPTTGFQLSGESPRSCSLRVRLSRKVLTSPSVYRSAS